MADPKTDALADLEVTMTFEPARISKQMLERAYELLLPLQRRQLQSSADPNRFDAGIKRQQAADKMEVA